MSAMRPMPPSRKALLAFALAGIVLLLLACSRPTAAPASEQPGPAAQPPAPTAPARPSEGAPREAALRFELQV